MQILGKKMGSKRNIFEEVSGSETKVANSEIKTGIIEQSEHISDRRQVRSWLICLFTARYYIAAATQSSYGVVGLFPCRD